MYWNWLSIVFAVAGVLFVGYGILAAREAGFFGATFVAIGCMSFASIYFVSYLHDRDERDLAAKAALRSQGFPVVEVETAGHRATLAIGDACTRELRLEKRHGRWQLLMEQPNGERRAFLRSMIDDGGKACSVDIR